MELVAELLSAGSGRVLDGLGRKQFSPVVGGTKSIALVPCPRSAPRWLAAPRCSLVLPAPLPTQADMLIRGVNTYGPAARHSGQ